MQAKQHSIMIVSRNPKMIEFLKSAMPPDRFHPILVVTNAGEARRIILRSPYDIILIDTPLPDEFGTKLALDLSDECAVAVIVKPELIDRASYKLEKYGIVTLPRTLYKSVLYQTLILLGISVSKRKQLSEEKESLKSRLSEIKALTRAKALLISKKHMTEQEAHRYIEKMAMDKCIKKAEAVALIINELSDDFN